MPHIHDKIDFTVSAFVCHKDRVLLRYHEKYYLWLGVGGHIELDEDPNSAVHREVTEEVGLDIELMPYRDKEATLGIQLPPELAGELTELNPPAFMNIHYVDNQTHQHIDLIYLAQSNSDAVTPENDDDQWAWFSARDLDEWHEALPHASYLYGHRALEVCRERA